MKKFTLVMALMLILPPSVNLGTTVKIEDPADGSVFHHRNVTIRGVATACCGDKLTEWEWTWRWSNGSYSESHAIDFKRVFEFQINISLYPGANEISVLVRASSGGEARGNITIYYDGPLAISNGPYEGRANEKINFHGSAYGGYKPYSWLWEFGDGTTSNEQNPKHMYGKEGIYKVTLTVTDSKGYSDTNYTLAIIGEADKNPPIVEIIRPSPGIYVQDREIAPFFIPLIIGSVTIEAIANDADTGVRSIAFYVDNELKFNDTSAPYSWLCDESIGMHEIKAIAYDYVMNYAVDTIKILVL